jgi:hypothetical protein
VADRRGVAGGICGVSRGATQVSRRRVRMASRSASVPPGDLASSPRSAELDCASGSVVVGPRLLEQAEHVLGAIGRPGGQQAMVVVRQGPAPAHGDEARIPDLRQDHHRSFEHVPSEGDEMADIDVSCVTAANAPYGIVRVSSLVALLTSRKWVVLEGERSKDVSLIAKLQRGDLVAYFNEDRGRYTHMAFYLGNGKIACHTYCRFDKSIESAVTWDDHWDLGARKNFTWTFLRFVI